MRARFALVLASVAVASGLVSPRASAQTSTDSTAADVLFEEGRAALSRGEVKTACDRFEASRRLEPAIGTLLNLAECSAKLERRRSAWIAFREALRTMPASDDRRAYAEGRVRELEAKLGRIVLRWNGPAVVGSEVVVNDEPITPPYDVPRIVDPGKLVVRAAAPGRRGRSFEATIVEGGTATLVIDAGERADRAEPPPSAGAEPSSSSRRVFAFALVGAGAASLGAGAFFGVSALGASADAKDRCGGGLACADESSLSAARGDAERASSQAVVSTILLGAGAVLAGAGVYLVLTSPSPRTAASLHRRTGIPLRFEF